MLETLWLRWLRLLLGATAPATSATLLAFLAGQALGAATGARLAARVRHPLRTYGLLEIAGALAALLVPVLLGLGRGLLDGPYDALVDQPGLLTFARLALALAATLPAATALGATLPVLSAAVVRRPDGLGSRAGGLYGVHVLGAACGVALASFVLVDAFGVRASYGIGAGLLAAAGLGALGLSRLPAFSPEGAQRTRESDRGVQRDDPAQDEGPTRLRDLAAVAALSGFGTFALQVLGVQAFALVLNQSTQAFGAVLFVVLGSLGLAAAGVATLLRTGRIDARALLGTSLAGAAVASAALPWVFVHATDGLTYLGAEGDWPAYLVRALATAALALGPPLLLAGAVLPATFAAAGQRTGQTPPGVRVGRLLLANTLGAAAGALAGPWLLLPAFGPWGAMQAVAVAYALGAALLPGPARPARAGIALAGVAVLMVLAGPARLPLVPLQPGESLRQVESTPSGLVAVVERDEVPRIQIDNHYTLGGAADRVHQERQGHLGLLLRPGARRVAFLGTATGSSASAARLHDVRELAAVELVPAVARLARELLPDAGGAIYGLPGTRLVVDDARNHMRATQARFDAVVSDLFVPWRSGAGALFTREHFEAVRTRLAEDGAFCQWLPLYQLSEEEFLIIAATFHDVFPTGAVFRGDFYGRHPIAALVGYRDDPPPAHSVAAAAIQIGERGAMDRWVSHPLGPFALYAGPLSAIEGTENLPRNTDDRPVIELRAARSHAGGRRGKQDAFVGLRWAAFQERLATARTRRGDDFWPGLPVEARRASEGGRALQGASALYVAGREQEAGRALAVAAELLPPALLAEAPEDPTASDVWHAGP